ncbi:hypothetical protein LINGRAHAP2_LOCUS31874 [Linum grandiflorum]
MQTEKNLMQNRRAVEEERGLVVVVNKMDLLKGKRNSTLSDKDTGIPIVFTLAIESKCRILVMRQVIMENGAQESRLSMARLNRRIRKAIPDRGQASRIGDSVPNEIMKEDSDLGGIPLRNMERHVPKNNGSGQSSSSRNSQFTGSSKIFGVDNKIVEA